jgi:hypothetical protein
MPKAEIEKLNNPEKISEFNQVIDDLVRSDDVGGAKKILSALIEVFDRNPEFQKEDPLLFSIYYKYLVAVKYINLFDLEEGEILGLIKKDFDFFFKYPEYDLVRKLRYKIRDILDLEARDLFKSRLRSALLECGALLSEKKIVLNNNQVPASVANWLKDYYTQVGMDKVDTLKVSQYLTNSPNIKLISPEEKDDLKRLLNLFENLKVSSQEFPIFEESVVAILPDRELALILNGQMANIGPEVVKLIEEIAALENFQQMEATRDVLSDAPVFPEAAVTAVPRTAELQEMLNNYPPDSLEYKAISQEIMRLQKTEARKNAKK